MIATIKRINIFDVYYHLNTLIWFKLINLILLITVTKGY